MDNKKTLVVGASINPQRYSHQAVLKLRNYGHDVIAYGPKPGIIGDVIITHEFPQVDQSIDVVTMYIGSDKQTNYYDDIIHLKPKLVIFNPGTENDIFYSLLNQNGIAYEEACTLVKLSIGNY